jgi:diguanylate cyclase (GGDEF)-like protein
LSSPAYLSPTKPFDYALSRVEKVPRLLLVVLGLLWVYATGYLDYVAGKDISPQILYLVPVGVVSWCVGRNEGYLIAVNCGLARLLSDWINARGDALGFVPHWNGGSFFVIAMTFALVLSSLRARLDHEKDLARTDALTGVCNARSFIERAGNELERARRQRYAFSIAYIDCDNFKQVNDRLGHTIGDELLKTVAQTMKHSARPFDIVSRLGGDEFAVFLSEVEFAQALPVMERLRERLLEVMRKNAWPVTFSIGVVTFSEPPESVGEMLRYADEAMYAAKHGGKNSIKQTLWPLPHVDSPTLKENVDATLSVPPAETPEILP